jgi:uncharacterized integral membrane protein
MTLVRRIIPYTLLPLSLIACGLASSPWLRAFPSSVLAVPLFGAALLSILAPLIVIGIGVRRLWVTALIDLVLCVFYELIATLREPVGFADLWSGLVHGPSQILTFALPLVSPRELMVAPVALCWLTGALIGECIARGWHSVLPYVAMLVTFGLAYAGTARAITSADDGRRYDTLLAGALLLTLLLLRAAQAWVIQDESAEMTQPDGVLPLRGLAIGTVLSVVIAAGAAGMVQSTAFAGRPATPARVPPVDQSRPLSPVAFVSSLRPPDPKTKGVPLFKVSTDRSSSPYISLATVNFYDGDGWSFDRTFRPSGGVIPADADPSMRPATGLVTQTYTIDEGPLTRVPWMPYLERAQRVTGVAVNIDPDSGMIVPARTLGPAEEYTVRSRVPSKTFDQIGPTASIGTSVLTNDTTLDSDVSAPLGTLVNALSQETGTSSGQPIAFLQAVAKDFRTKSSLAGGTATPAAGPSAGGTAGRTPPAVPAPSVSAHTGGTAFADVLASIRSTHAATPEQYATLTALIARKLGVPARVVSGFRVGGDSGKLTPGTYDVTSTEAWSWVEIPVRGQGWVVLDPSPATYSGQQPRPSTASTPSPTPSSTPAQTAQLTNGNTGNAAAKPSKVPHKNSLEPVSLAVVGAIIVGALLVVLLGLLLARKWVRVRRRRRIADPRRRLLGAWQESLDFLVEAGLPEVRSMTSAEIAAATAEKFGGDPAAQVRFIGDAANVAIFSPSAPVGPADADAAWRAESVLTRSVRRRLDWRRRLGTRLRYHRGRRTTALVGPSSWAAAAHARAVTPRGGKHSRAGQRRTGRR